MLQLLNYINGELISPVSQSFLDNYNPANGAVYSQLPDSDAQDVELAFQAAKNAFPAWKNTSTEEPPIKTGRKKTQWMINSISK